MVGMDQARPGGISMCAPRRRKRSPSFAPHQPGFSPATHSTPEAVEGEAVVGQFDTALSGCRCETCFHSGTPTARNVIEETQVPVSDPGFGSIRAVRLGFSGRVGPSTRRDDSWR